MENILPLLLLVAYIVIALVKKKNPEQGAPSGKPSPNQGPQPKPVDLETIFEDFFGKEKQQPQYETDSDLPEDFDLEPVASREPTAIEEAFEEKGYDYDSYESENIDENVFQEHTNNTNVGANYKFSEEMPKDTVSLYTQGSFGVPESPEFADENDFSDSLEELDDFSPRDAVIYSEIINKKY
jgi:hypothetical protein